MKTLKNKYFLIQCNRANHSADHVFNNGKIIISGKKMDCLKELSRMKKFCKDKYNYVNTNQNKQEYLAYEMSDIFCIKKESNQLISFF